MYAQKRTLMYAYSGSNRMFAVTGATGQLGRKVVNSLLKHLPASEVAALVRNPVNGGVKPGHWAVQNPASTAGTQASAGRA